jgi:hypothetical protein
MKRLFRACSRHAIAATENSGYMPSFPAKPLSQNFRRRPKKHICPGFFEIMAKQLFPKIRTQPPFFSILVSVSVLGFPLHGFSQEISNLDIGGAKIRVSFDSIPAPEFRRLTVGWITRAANAVTIYYAGYPVRTVDVQIHVGSGKAVGPGSASGYGGPHIQVEIGSAITARDLQSGRNNWLMTHEMVHLALSSVEERHHWLEEGLATYVEPIARVRSGELDAREVWRDMMESMPQGEPHPGDRGLDHTPTWGRTYWGGAIFCLLADVEIRKDTNNKMGLENALRGIVAAGGTIDTDWGLTRVLETGDRAIGGKELETLYDRMKGSPVPVNLATLWQQLGVEDRDGSVIFHDEAPFAAIRMAIMSP